MVAGEGLYHVGQGFYLVFYRSTAQLWLLAVLGFEPGASQPWV